jgi:hypothetical protein
MAGGLINGWPGLRSRAAAPTWREAIDEWPGAPINDWPGAPINDWAGGSDQEQLPPTWREAIDDD